MNTYRVKKAAALIAAVVGLAYAQTPPKWDNLYPSYNGLAFGDVSGGTFVAASGDGVIQTIDNSFAVSQSFSPAGGVRSFHSAAFGNGRFAVTQNSTNLLLSDDGRTWEPSSDDGNYICRYITYGHRGFVGVGDAGAIGDPVIFTYYGNDWSTSPDIAPSDYLNHIAWGSNRYVAVGSNVISATTPTPTSGWSQATDIASASNFGAVAFGDGKFVAVGASGAYATTNGTNWGVVSATSLNGIADMTFGGGKFVAVGSGGKIAVSSDDGVSWAVSTHNERDNFKAVKYGNGQFVALGAYGSVYSSSDGTNWNPLKQGRFISYRRIAYSDVGGGTFVAVGDSGASVSSDGTNWLAVNQGLGFKMLRDVAYGKGLFVAVGDSGAIFTSSDGNTWTDRSYSGIMLTSVAISGDRFVAGGRGPIGPSVLTSGDGLNWAENTHIEMTGWSQSERMTAMDFGGGKFLAASTGMGGQLRSSVSTGGVHWTNVEPAAASPYEIVSIVYANSKFIALGVISSGDSTMVFSSPTGDADSWTTIKAPPGVRSATFVKGFYVTAGDAGKIYARTQDGSSWIQQPMMTSRNLQTVFADGDDAIIVAGAAGAMLYSTDTPTLIPPVTSIRPAATASRNASANMRMTLDNSRKSAPSVTLSFTPSVPGTIAVYSLTGRQIYKKSVLAGERTVRLSNRMMPSGSVIVRYVGGDGRTVSQRFQLVR